MKQVKTSFNVLLIIFIISIFVFNPINTKFLFAQEGEIDEINEQIESKKQEIEKLNQQSDVYRDNIQEIQSEALSLRNEIAIIENRIAKAELDIQSTVAEIEKVHLETAETERQINTKQEKIDQQKEQLAEYIRVLYKNGDKNYLEVLLLNDSFSEFFDEIRYTEDLQIELQNVVDQVQDLKSQLEEQKQAQENQKNDLVILQQREIEQKEKLEETMSSKETILAQSENNETKFYNLYWQSKQEQSNINNDLYNLERELRAKLDKQAEENKNQDNSNSEDFLLGSSGFIWPVADHSRGISAYFHDPEYPFRYIFEHPGIDIRAYQGTPLRAIDNGYVARAKNAGMGYSYVMLIHANGFSSVYGHMSRIDVKEDSYVTKGQIIGLSGGMPGTPGAGNLTTGPHLHFEIRSNGIPVNPLDYLP